MEAMLDIKEEAGKLSDEAKALLRFLMDGYAKAGRVEYDKREQITGMDAAAVASASDELVGSGFAYGSTSRPQRIRLNRSRMDSLRSIGKI
jgi:hypothetical protein